MPKGVAWLVNIFNCFAYDWAVKDEWKVTWHITWHDTKEHVVRCLCITKEKRKKKDTTVRLHKIKWLLKLEIQDHRVKVDTMWS
jgi:hypothetical protein